MYLLPQSTGPLSCDRFVVTENLLKSLAIVDGKLPTDIEARLDAFARQQPPLAHWLKAIVHVAEKGATTKIHYSIGRRTTNSPWKLKKAWRTDQRGHTIEKCPVP